MRCSALWAMLPTRCATPDLVRKAGDGAGPNRITHAGLREFDGERPLLGWRVPLAEPAGRGRIDHGGLAGSGPCPLAGLNSAAPAYGKYSARGGNRQRGRAGCRHGRQHRGADRGAADGLLVKNFGRAGFSEATGLLGREIPDRGSSPAGATDSAIANPDDHDHAEGATGCGVSDHPRDAGTVRHQWVAQARSCRLPPAD